MTRGFNVYMRLRGDSLCSGQFNPTTDDLTVSFVTSSRLGQAVTVVDHK